MTSCPMGKCKYNEDGECYLVCARHWTEDYIKKYKLVTYDKDCPKYAEAEA